jgi:CRISPR-associated autoregulator DevR family
VTGENRRRLTHVAGTFAIQADGAFLNGAGLGEGEDRNVTVPKTFFDGRNRVPYVSAQAWKRWLRITASQEAGWPQSEPQAIGWNPKGNVNKIAGMLNPVEFPEDDIFGYMRAQEGQGRRKAAEDEDEEEEDGGVPTKAVMRASPFAASLLVSLRSEGWKGEDEGFVHLTKYDVTALANAELERFLSAFPEKRQDKRTDTWKRLEQFDQSWSVQVRSAADSGDLDGLRALLSEKAKEKGRDVKFIENATSPLPYSTRFYNTNLQAVFCLDYSRLGVFWNLGDRVELEPSKAKKFVQEKVIEDVSLNDEYKALTQNGRLGRIYRRVNGEKERKSRASELLNALAVLRGGAKQAQFGTDVSPKALLLCGLTCGNPILNHLFSDSGGGPTFRVETFKEVICDYSDRIATPVLVGLRTGYFRNQEDVEKLNGWWRVERETKAGGSFNTKSLQGPLKERAPDGEWVEIRVMTPPEAARYMGELLP